MLKIIKKISVLILFFSICCASYAADTSTAALNQLLTNIRSMRADFTQRLLDNHGKTIQLSQGKMALQRPGQFRWETLSPNPQLIVTNGTRLWIYDRDLEQVVIRSLVKQTGETPALLLSDANPELSADYHIKEVGKSSENQRTFLLLPKDSSSMMASIKMQFTNNQLQEMQLADHLGHATIIQFKQIKMNIPIAAQLFKFTPPKHVDVIDETKH